jgi:L-amino acid N-acyltransferase YncA
VSARIRLALPGDAGAIAAIYRPSVTASVTSFELEPPDAQEMLRRMERVLARTPWIVCESIDGVVGYAYATGFRDRAAYQWSVEVSAYVRQDAQRSGIGRALYTSLFAILVLQGFRNALAGITLPNAASVGLHRTLGFTPVGVYRGVGYKAGAWHDVQWLELQLAERVADPRPPVPLPSLLSAPALEEALNAGAPLLRPSAQHT